jgi:hypothetical protein
MIEDTIKVTGDLLIQVTNAAGEVIDSRDIRNMIVDTGRNMLAGLLAGDTVKPTHIALGSNNQASAIGQTGLITETAGTRRAFNSAASVGNVATFVTTYPIGSSGTYREAGLFSAVTAGVMLARTSFNAVTKTTADNLVITWSIRIN